MQSLPLFLSLHGQPVLVLGDGEAADAKRRLVAEAGGVPVAALVPGTRIAFVALADGAEAEAARLRAAGLLVNVVDRPALCDFTVPAIVDRTPLLIAIGTGGASASLAKALKERLELMLSPALGAMASAVRDARSAVAARHGSVAARRAFWAGLLAPGAPLDPLGTPDDPARAIADALKGTAARPESLHHIRVGPAGAEGLTLAQLRLMAQADLVVLGPGLPADVRTLIRRDAARFEGRAPPADARGHILVIAMES